MPHPRAAAIRRMFDAISPRYDLLNHLLSAGIDRRWRAKAAGRARAALGERGGPDSRAPRLLDVCTGTGDLAFAVLESPSPPDASLRVVGVDFSHPMLGRAREKAASFWWRLGDRDGNLKATLEELEQAVREDPPPYAAIRHLLEREEVQKLLR